MPKFQLKRDDEEHEEYFIDGKLVGSSNHDDHGWAGMEGVRNMFEACAEAVGEKVTDMPESDAPTDDQKQKLWGVCAAFIHDQNIHCAEVTVEDRVYANAPPFVEQLAEIVGYHTEDE